MNLSAILFAAGIGVVALAEAFTRGPSITFLNKAQTAELLRADADGFVAGLSPADLHARKAQTNLDYLSKAIASAMEYTIRQQDRITRLIDTIQYDQVPLEQYGMSPSKFKAIPWTIALATYEDEYPHTRGAVIFLSPDVLTKTDRQLQKTLIHEQVHVYQKMYPEDVRSFVHVMGYREAGPTSMDPRLRANPDLDRTVYRGRNGEMSGLRYRSKAPASIDDVQGDPKDEHPFEMIAYVVSQER